MAAFPSPGGLPSPGTERRSPALRACSSPAEPPGGWAPLLHQRLCSGWPLTAPCLERSESSHSAPHCPATRRPPRLLCPLSLVISALVDSHLQQLSAVLSEGSSDGAATVPLSEGKPPQGCKTSSQRCGCFGEKQEHFPGFPSTLPVPLFFWAMCVGGGSCPMWSFPCGSDSKEAACNAGDPGLIPGLGRSPGEGNRVTHSSTFFNLILFIY